MSLGLGLGLGAGECTYGSLAASASAACRMASQSATVSASMYFRMSTGIGALRSGTLVSVTSLAAVRVPAWPKAADAAHRPTRRVILEQTGRLQRRGRGLVLAAKAHGLSSTAGESSREPRAVP